LNHLHKRFCPPILLVWLPVYEKGIVQDMKLIIAETEFEPLGHLVRPALPGEPLIIQRFLTNIYYG
jgi:hypothetical protein